MFLVFPVCHAVSYSDHLSSLRPEGPGIAAWTPSTFSLLPQTNQKIVSNMQCRSLPSDLHWVLVNVEIKIFGFKVWQTALLVKWHPSVFSGVFRLALSSWEIFPSRSYGCESFPGVQVPFILHREMFFFSGGSSVDKVIQCQAVTKSVGVE